MIDTGLDSSFRQEGNVKGWFAKNYIRKTKQAPGQNIAAMLQKASKSRFIGEGGKLKINGIFFTHLHADHTAGLPELTDIKAPKIMGKGEEFHYLPFLYTSNHLDKVGTLYELDAKGAKMGALDAVLDVFGDQSLLAVATPGHSQGHTSYLLMTTKGAVLLTGDASHTKYGFEHNIAPGWVDDRPQAQNSLAQLRAFKKNHPEVKVIYGHER